MIHNRKLLNILNKLIINDNNVLVYKSLISLFYFRWLYLQHRKEAKESYEQLPDTDVLKDSNGVVTKYGAIKP